MSLNKIISELHGTLKKDEKIIFNLSTQVDIDYKNGIELFKEDINNKLTEEINKVSVRELVEKVSSSGNEE